jgi:hypothetical protein
LTWALLGAREVEAADGLVMDKLVVDNKATAKYNR